MINNTVTIRQTIAGNILGSDNEEHGQDGDVRAQAYIHIPLIARPFAH
jgi:hypothetical protein